ncbi:MAG: Fe2+-dependent dioxygenase [Burkholderiaceae bacterium]
MLDIPKILSSDQVDDLRQRIEAGRWTSGEASAGEIAGMVKRNRQLDAHSTVARQASEQVLNAVRQNSDFMSASLANRFYPPMFNRYKSEETYGLHIDNSMMRVAPDQPLLRTDLSATLFLTDADQYEGGELVVHTRFGEQEIKLDAGDLILYSSSSLHQVNPVTAGERVSAVFWVESLVPEDDRRDVLFELDCSIRILRSQVSNNALAKAEITRLTGVYHNLIRLWSRR